MFKKFFRRIKFKAMARQLRRPNGVIGNEVANMMNKANEALYDFTLDTMQIANNNSILEIGFGNGKFFEKIFSRANGLKITGLDFSEAMFVAARENNEAAITTGQLELHFGSSEKISFPDNSFDKIFCINVIYFWDKPSQHLQQMLRVLKPGGRFYATVRTKESMLRMPFTKYGFSFYDTEKWKALLTETGLKFVEEKFLDEPEIVFEGNKFSVQSICAVAEK